MGTGIFAVFKVCLAHDGRAGTLAMGTVMVPSGEVSADNCPVFPADLPLYHLIGKDTALNICFAMIKSLKYHGPVG